MKQKGLKTEMSKKEMANYKQTLEREKVDWPTFMILKTHLRQETNDLSANTIIDMGSRTTRQRKVS